MTTEYQKEELGLNSQLSSQQMTAVNPSPLVSARLTVGEAKLDHLLSQEDNNYKEIGEGMELSTPDMSSNSEKAMLGIIEEMGQSFRKEMPKPQY